MANTIEIANMITVGELAEKLSLPATTLIAELFKNGVMITINEKIDFDTAQIIVEELNLEVKLKRITEKDIIKIKDEVIKSKNMASRPPVVAVMGHVDHGKTSLLDVIRGENVAAGEAGGITQHISAYQIEFQGRKITFLDTPGHEAFSALREHGANLTDIAIIVVAADDGVKPQTIEAIRFAKNAKVKIIIAITKIDKEAANIDRTKQQLAEQNLTPEDWGGDTIIVPVSSKTKEGVDKLLEMVLLLADVEELKAAIDIPGKGLVIESHMERGRGPIAWALIQQGKVQQGDFVVAGTTRAKIRVLEDSTGKPIKEALPSTPIRIVGFKSLPQFGDKFTVVKDEKSAKKGAGLNVKDIAEVPNRLDISSSDIINLINRRASTESLNIIIKTDVQGSLTSVVDSLKTLETAEVVVRIVGSGVGAISDNDIRMAAASNAIIYGFQTTMPINIKKLADREKVRVRLYRVIYELIDDAKQEMTSLLAPEEIITNIGRLIVKGIFNTTKTETIAGGEVTKGKLVLPAYADIYRDKEIIAKNITISNLKQGPTDTKELLEGSLGGLSLTTTNKLDLKEGDRLEVFTKEIRAKTLV